MEYSPIVTTGQGQVRGITLADGDAGHIHRFLGIPYAAPPVGPNRFHAPQPAAPLHDSDQPFDASSFGPPPPQFDSDPASFAPHRAGDDWLTVNVWTPRLPDGSAAPQSALPVMVWIYGGSYVNGCSANREFDGTAFARDGVVFVSLNYRLGVEGFAHFPDAPDNRGLLDQVAALRWVRENIAAFGGDPGNVTVFGESAGAGSIQMLLTMPSADGLFRRAIVQSPPTMVLGANLAADVSTWLAGVANEKVATEAPDGTRQVPTAGADSPTGNIPATAAGFAEVSPDAWPAIMRHAAAGQMEQAARWGRAVAFTPPLCPVVDGTVLPADPWQAVRDGAGADVDLIVGQTATEFTLFMAYDPHEITRQEAQRALTTMGPAGRAHEYAALMPEATAEQLFERVQSDRVFTTAALDLAAGHACHTADTTGATYVYVFDVNPAGGIGAPHVAEVPPLFNEFDDDHGALIYPERSPADRELGARMRRSWTAFATTGNPNAVADGLSKWRRWTAQAATVDNAATASRIWAHQPEAVAHPFAARWASFADDPARPLDLEG